MQWKTVYPHSGWLWSLRLMVAAGLLTGLLVWLLSPGAVLWTALACMWAAAAFLGLYYLPKQAKCTMWRLEGAELVVRKGVWFRRTLRILQDQLQCVGRLHTPLSRRMGVETVLLYIPGRVWVLDGVRREDAQWLESCAKLGKE